jgi:threonine/homoserine/homoserine lactone efflux protein
MLWKILTLAVLIWFAWWRLRQWLRERRLRDQGEQVPEKRGIRPISILAGGMLLGYGGYLVWVILMQTLETFRG